MEISDYVIPKSAPVRASTKDAWARYARRRWPQHTVAGAGQEWDLSEPRARGLVHGTITQSTIDAIRRHGRGGLLTILEVEAIAFGVSADELVHHYIAIRQKEHDRERIRLAAQEASTLALARRLDAAWPRSPDPRAREGSAL